MLTVPELLDLVVRLEDDATRRDELGGNSYSFFKAAVDEGLVRDDQRDGFAALVGEAYHQGALGFRRTHGGAIIPDPDEYWTVHAFESRNGYFSTVTGQQIAALYRERRAAETSALSAQAAAPPETSKERDVFICHASEDKETVARPLAEALKVRGWSAWLDELELTIGDSLSGNIETALATSRFGVAILSPASFTKEWPQRELQGLAAREVAAGTKVILPVWHEVDQQYIVERAPILADRLGARTSDGIPWVADQISQALERAGREATGGRTQVVQAVEQPDRPGEPPNSAEMSRLIRNLHQRNLGVREERERSAQASPLERWLESRIAEAERHRRERVVLGTPAWQKAMHGWEAQNVTKLADDYPTIVEGYRGDPSGHLSGLENEEAFYERQLGWLRATLEKLHENAS